MFFVRLIIVSAGMHSSQAIFDSRNMSNKDWDDAALNYNSFFVPKFTHLYSAMVSKLPADATRIFGLGEGGGEPSLSIAQDHSCDITVSDASEKMLEIARARFAAAGKQATFILNPDLKSLHGFDACVASLSLMYVDASERQQVVNDLFNALKPNGVLITSHWAHPLFVPTIRILKQTKLIMDNSLVDLDAMGQSGPFALNNPSIMHTLLKNAGFVVESISAVDVLMKFKDVSDLMDLTSSVYDDPERARQVMDTLITEHLLEEEEERVVDGSFVLSNEAVVIVARKY